MKSIKQSIDDMVSQFKIAKQENAQSPGRMKAQSPIALWLPPAYKEKYDSLQDISGKQFGKGCMKLIMTAIDEIEKQK